MDAEHIRRKAYHILYILGILTLLFIVCWILSFLKHVVILLSVAILLAYVLAPMVEFFNQPIVLQIREYVKMHHWKLKIPLKRKNIVIHRRGFSRIVSIIIVYFFLLGIGLIVIFYLVPIISAEFNNLLYHRAAYIKSATDAYNRAYEWVTPRIPEVIKEQIPLFTTKITEEIRNFSVGALQHTIPAVKSFLSYFALIFIIPLVTFYILMDVDVYKKGFMALVPETSKLEVSELLHDIDLMLGRYIRGQLLVCAVIGISVTIALLIMDIQYAVLIGVFAGVIDIIPYVGVVLGMIPAVILALFKHPLYALLVLAVLYFIHWSEGHIIVPNIMGQTIGLPPLVVIVALIIGAETMGILGMFLAIPIASVIKVVFNHYIRRIARGSLSPPQEKLMIQNCPAPAEDLAQKAHALPRTME
jgi:predicted PurR-regulated permease PerM